MLDEELDRRKEIIRALAYRSLGPAHASPAKALPPAVRKVTLSDGERARRTEALGETLSRMRRKPEGVGEP